MALIREGVRRRVGSVRVDSMMVLDLTEEVGRQTIGITLDDLTGDDLEQCQRVAALAREHGLDEILSPSAALPDSLTLVVFATSVEKITVELSVVNTPPARLADLLARIRLHGDVPDSVRSLLRYIETLGSEARRRRKSSPWCHGNSPRDRGHSSLTVSCVEAPIPQAKPWLVRLAPFRIETRTLRRPGTARERPDVPRRPQWQRSSSGSELVATVECEV